ncbi:ubiquitin-conjugating enzyme/RWD-like protein [Artemisia annua]|uniref:Ubiquitin-conjugating enzyme/RWD-like protein n=1 Tax=Artemisia annua TaxID=35608 RepID=A0A2U1MAM5_ARTAN|nr:ubiquitin-conjugating enzyme/RWD-like protein [Artemisia annua]
MKVWKGQIMFLLEATEQEEGDASSSEPPNESSFSSEKSHALAVETTRETLVRFRNSRTGVFSMEDVLVDHHEDTSCPLAGLDNEEVLKNFKSFKKFDILSDHTGHRFSTFNPLMNRASAEGWAERIEEEWTILEIDLPGIYYIREGCKPKMDLLSALIVGPKGTPYHDDLYFFDMFIPRSYPESPPICHLYLLFLYLAACMDVLWYNSGGLGINPNLLTNGGVELTMPLVNGQGIEMDMMWVPVSTNLLKLLVSIQDQFFHSNPLRNDVAHGRGDSVYTQQSCLLYNENTLLNLKSLKTMVYIMNKPPKNFEDFVVGHFRNRVCDILMACEAYMEGKDRMQM